MQQFFNPIANILATNDQSKKVIGVINHYLQEIIILVVMKFQK